MGYLALISHDDKKDAMIALVQRRRGAFAHDALVATQTTGKLIERETGLTVTKMFSGPLGGDLPIGAMIGTNLATAEVILDHIMAHRKETS